MPITQDRLLRLISAGEHFRDTSLTLRQSLNVKAARIFSHEISFEQAIAELSHELNTSVPFDATAAATLAEERTRYNITHKRNSIEKRRLYNKRHPTPITQPGFISQSASVPTAHEVLTSVNSRFPGASTDDDLDLSPDAESDTPSSADIQAAINRTLSNSKE